MQHAQQRPPGGVGLTPPRRSAPPPAGGSQAWGRAPRPPGWRPAAVAAAPVPPAPRLRRGFACQPVKKGCLQPFLAIGQGFGCTTVIQGLVAAC